MPESPCHFLSRLGLSFRVNGLHRPDLVGAGNFVVFRPELEVITSLAVGEQLQSRSGILECSKYSRVPR